MSLPLQIHSFPKDQKEDAWKNDKISSDQNQYNDFDEILDRLNSQSSQRNNQAAMKLRPFPFLQNYDDQKDLADNIQNQYCDDQFLQKQSNTYLEPEIINKNSYKNNNDIQNQMLGQNGNNGFQRNLNENQHTNNSKSSQNFMNDYRPISSQFIEEYQQNKIAEGKIMDKQNGHLYKSKSVEKNMVYLENNMINLKKKHNKKKKEPSQIGFSTFEEFEQIKFQFYDLSQKIKDQNNMIQNQNFQSSVDSQYVQIPIQIWNQLKKQNQDICQDYNQMQDQLLNNFEQQIQIHQKYQKKNKHQKRLLRDYENQSMLLMRDQKMQEESFKDLTKKHDINNNQIDQVLNNIEFQVNKKKLQVLSKQNKQQLEIRIDNAFQKMINSENQDFEIDNVFNEFIHILRSFGQIDFINKNTSDQHIEASQTQRNQINHHELYNDCDSKILRQKTPNIPKLPIERISIAPAQDPKAQADQTNRPFQNGQQNSKIQKQRTTLKTNRGSSRQYSQVSQRSQKNQLASYSGITNQNSQEKKEQPQIINEAEEKEESVIITNPVMVGVMNKTSKFEHKYEDDYDGANVTLDMKTERLKQFPEEYEMLMNIQDPDQRILLKQQVFFVYEKLLRKQAKQEKKRRKQQKKELIRQQQEQQNQKQEIQHNDQIYNINQINVSQDQNLNLQKKENQKSQQKNQQIHDRDFSSASSQLPIQGVNRQNEKGLGMNERHVEANDVSQIVTSRFSLQSELPSIDTQEIISAQKRYRALDVNQSEIIDLEISVNGLKTATQKSLIKKIDEEFRQKEIQKKQFKDNEAKMNYSSSVVSKINSGSNYDNYDQINRDGNYNSNNYFSNNNEDNKQNEKLIWIADSDSNRSASDKHNQISYTDADQNNKNSHKNVFEYNPDHSDFQQSDRYFIYEQVDPNVNNNIVQQPFSKRISKNNSNHSKANSLSSQKKVDSKDNIKDMRKSYIKIDDHQQTDLYIQDLNKEQFKNIHNQNIIENIKVTEKKNKKKELPINQRNFICENNEQDLHLEVIQERLSEFSLSLITNAARLNSHRSRQSKTNINQYENQGSIVNKKGNSINFSSITINSNNLVNNQLNRQESLSYIHESEQKHISDICKEEINNDSEDIQKKINFRSVSYQVLAQNDNDLCMNHYQTNEPQKKKSYQKEIIKVEHQKQRLNQKIEKEILNNEINSNKMNKDFQVNDNFQIQANTDRTNKYNQNQHPQNIEYKSLSHRQHIMGSLVDKQDINKQQMQNKRSQNNKVLLTSNQFPIIAENNQKSLIDISNQKDGIVSNFKSKQDQQNQFEQIKIRKFQQLQEIQIPIQKNFQMDENEIQQNDVKGKSYNVDDILIGQVDLNGSLENLDQHKQEVYNTQESIGKQILQVANQFHDKPQGRLIRSSSECMLRDKEFYDMCDDEDEIVLYCKLAEQSILDAIQMRNQSDYQHVSRIKVAATENDPFRDSITQNQIDFSQMQSQSLQKINFMQRHQSSSQNPNNQMVFMSQKTMNKMYNRYLQTQDKTQLLIGKQFVNNIIDNAASATVDKNSSQQQTRGKATFNRIMLGGGVSSIQGGLLKFPQQNLNQNINSSNYLGTNLLLASFNDCTLPFCHNIMMPTHQYNRRTLLMMQNLHNNYLYSANSGILFTQRGWNSGLAPQMTSDNGSYMGPGTKIGQSLKNLGNIDNLNKEMTAGIIEREGIESDLRVKGDKLNQNKINFENKIIDNQQNTIKNQEIKLLSGEPINISNFIFGAKQQTKDQKNQSCITIVDDDCKIMIDRKLLNEAKNQSHQMKFKNLFSQSKTLARIPQCQQSSCDFSQQQTEHINLKLKFTKRKIDEQEGISSLSQQSNLKKFDFKNNQKVQSKQIDSIDQKIKLSENQIKFQQKQINNQNELKEKGNLQNINLKIKDQSLIEKQLEESINQQKNFSSIKTQMNFSKQQYDLSLKMQKSSSLEQKNKLKKLNGSTKILNLITGLKQIQERQAIKKQSDSNNNTLNIIQILDQQKKERALLKNQLNEDKSMDIENGQKTQEKLLIASGLYRTNNNSVQILKRKIKSSLSYQNQSLEKQQSKVNQDYQ